MSERVNETLQAIRQVFDAAFAAPAAPAEEGLEDVLVLAVGRERYAVRMTDLSGLERTGVVVPLPGARASLLGLTGVRGRLVPVFSLAAVLGVEGGGSAWLALAGRDEPVALAFDRLEAVVPSRRDAFLAADEAQATGGFVASAVAIDGEVLGVIRVEALLGALGVTEGETTA